jgi:hypothetical protein
MATLKRTGIHTMSRALINLCQPSKTEDLDALEFTLNDTDQAIARQIRASLAQQMAEKEVGDA